MIAALMIILHMFYVRFGQCISKLQSQILTTKLTSLRLIHSILITHKYYTAHFNFDSELLIKQKSLIIKFIYILFLDEKIFI